MKMQNPRNRRCERGVALLLALGSLSLMLVTGMAFLSNALIARHAAAHRQTTLRVRRWRG